MNFASEAVMWEFIRDEAFDIRYQPVVDLSAGKVIGHEALMMPQRHTDLLNPLNAFQLARDLELDSELDLACVRKILREFTPLQASTKLFVNINCATLQNDESLLTLMSVLESTHEVIGRSQLVIELTEVGLYDKSSIEHFIKFCRKWSIGIALDDFGVGHSNLEAWLEYSPEKIKIDRYFVDGIEKCPSKQQLLRGLRGMSDVLGTQLLAEGIETRQQLQVIQALGIGLGQGYLLGKPHHALINQLPADALSAYADKRKVVLAPERRRQERSGLIKPLMTPEIPLPDEATTKQAMELFANSAGRESVVLVDDHNRPKAVLSRSNFMNEMALPFRREVFGPKPVMQFANTSPVVLDENATLTELTQILAQADQRYLNDGLVITSSGAYAGTCTAHQLIRLVAENRIEAARHANPLTMLPGNMPINQHLERMLSGYHPFVLAYADINHFKPFNDRFGFWRGDDALLKTASLIKENVDPLHDFVGHVGGDDFVIVMQVADWQKRLQDIVDKANSAYRLFYSDEDQLAGGIEAEDRFGVKRFFPLITLTFGVITVHSGCRASIDRITQAVAEQKKRAKDLGLSIAFGEALNF